jgi:hypothetical protein
VRPRGVSLPWWPSQSAGRQSSAASYSSWLTFVPFTTLQAFGQDGRTVFSHHHSVIHRNNRLHNGYLHDEACSALYCAVCCLNLSSFGGHLTLDQFLDGAVIRGLRLFPDLDIQHFRSPTLKTRCRARICQRIFTAGKHRRLVSLISGASRLLTTKGGFFFLKPAQICVARVLGSDLCPLLCDLHIDERALHRNVYHLQTGAFPREQAPRAARDLIGQLSRSRIQISAVGSTSQ